MSRLCRLRTKTHGEDGQWAYDEITKLREQVSEIAAAKHMQREVDRVLVENHKLREQVAAQAAVIEKLREALKMSCWYVIFFHDTSEEANSKTKSAEAIEVLNEALAIPTDSTQILAEVRRAERERVAAWYEREGWIKADVEIVDRIRAME